MEYAEIAWNAYCKAVGGKSVNGALLPAWEDLVRDKAKLHVVLAWREAARAVEAECRRESERKIADLQDAYLNMREFAEANGLDTTTRNR